MRPPQEGPPGTLDPATFARIAHAGNVARVEYLEAKARAIPAHHAQWGTAAQILDRAKAWRWAIAEIERVPEKRGALTGNARTALLDMELLALQGNEREFMARHGRAIENSERARQRLQAAAKTANAKRARAAQKRRELYQRAALELRERRREQGREDLSVMAIAKHLSDNPPRGATAQDFETIRGYIRPVLSTRRP